MTKANDALTAPAPLALARQLHEWFGTGFWQDLTEAQREVYLTKASLLAPAPLGDDAGLVDMRRAAFAGGWNAAMGGGVTGTFLQKRSQWERENSIEPLLVAIETLTRDKDRLTRERDEAVSQRNMTGAELVRAMLIVNSARQLVAQARSPGPIKTKWVTVKAGYFNALLSALSTTTINRDG